MSITSRAVQFQGSTSESDPMFLQLDHINGGGGAERNNGFTHVKLARAIAHGLYPNVTDHIQVLCGSCHVAKSRNYGKLYDRTQPSRVILSQQNRQIKGIRAAKTSRHKNINLEGGKRWRAQFVKNGVKYNLGTYNTEDEAVAAVAKLREDLTR